MRCLAIKLYLVFLFVFSFCSSSFAQLDSRTEELIKKLSNEKNTLMNSTSVNELKSYLDERLVYIHTNGMTENKSEILENLKKNKWSIDTVVIKESNVRIFKNHTAILVGKGTFRFNLEEKKNMEIDIYFTEVWTKFKKGWVLLSRHGSKIQ
jgi:anion-transporting  ArsA/GET3 family ATPase